MKSKIFFYFIGQLINQTVEFEEGIQDTTHSAEDPQTSQLGSTTVTQKPKKKTENVTSFQTSLLDLL